MGKWPKKQSMRDTDQQGSGRTRVWEPMGAPNPTGDEIREGGCRKAVRAGSLEEVILV